MADLSAAMLFISRDRHVACIASFSQSFQLPVDTICSAQTRFDFVTPIFFLSAAASESVTMDSDFEGFVPNDLLKRGRWGNDVSPVQCVRVCLIVCVCGCVHHEGCLPLCSPYRLVVCCTARQAPLWCWRFALYKCFIIIIIISDNIIAAV